MRKIKHLQTITQKDVFPNMDVGEEPLTRRNTGKCLVFDHERQIALVGSSHNSIYTLPGGGIEDGEEIESGIKREIREEVGCTIEIERMIGMTEDYRNRDKKHYFNYCAVGNLVGEKQNPILTTEEEKNGLHVKWCSLEDAYSILKNEYEMVKNGEIQYYNTAYNVIRDLRFIQEYLSLNEIKSFGTKLELI